MLMNVNRKKPRPAHLWTDEQDDYLKGAISSTTYKDMAEHINETYSADVTDMMVKRHCYKLGLRTGRDTKFKKGQKPATAGKKTIYHSEESRLRAMSNSFRPGHIPHNYLPGIGRERKTKDGYTLIRVSDRRDIESRFNWMLKQRWVWEQEHGPIPKGWKVVFLDGSKDNFALDNLRAVPQGALSVFNRKYGYTGDPELNAMHFSLAELEYKTNKKRRDRNKNES